MARSTNITRDLLDRIRNAGGTGKHQDIYDHQQGFMVRVTPAGVISFCYRYRKPDGSYGRKTIGRYPGETVSEARAAALKFTQDLEHRIDTPGEILRKREKAASDTRAAMVVPTINGFLDDRYAKHLRLKLTRKEQAERTIKEIRKMGDAMPGALNIIDDETILDWIYDELEKETSTGKPMKPATVARKLKSLCGLFTLAVDCRIIDRNPVSSVQKKHKALLDEGEPRDRWLSYAKKNACAMHSTGAKPISARGMT
ncbi:Putative bacteriophage integrase (fragment) [Paraburkholderia piptadeniae]|uniref:Bacteriophage integrase n=1 Tax=Paraburkholderia piptadeniae TaxID=1701573 RepID=A0A1N7SFW7_9BURK